MKKNLSTRGAAALLALAMGYMGSSELSVGDRVLVGGCG